MEEILGYSSFFSALEWAAILDDDWSLVDDETASAESPLNRKGARSVATA